MLLRFLGSFWRTEPAVIQITEQRFIISLERKASQISQICTIKFPFEPLEICKMLRKNVLHFFFTIKNLLCGMFILETVPFM